MENDTEQLKMVLFQEFLTKTRTEKISELDKLKLELSLIEDDLKLVAKQMLKYPVDSSISSHRVPDFGEKSNRKRLQLNNRQHSSIISLDGESSNNSQRLLKQMPDLQSSYFEWRLKKQHDEIDLSADHLHFASSLVKCSQYTGFKTLASLHYADHFFNYSSSIVSSICFDKDDEFFATGGVTRKIKIYDYESVVSKGDPSTTNNINKNWDDFLGYQDTGEINYTKYPIREMVCQSKISCLSWNSYMKPLMISSDYEGSVSMWDAITGACVLKLEEHEKRVWSVDFSDVNPTVAASGSDDSRVKLWSTTLKYSTHTIESKANVCSVKFHPTNSNFLVFGSADHHVHYYDLRKLDQPVQIFTGHKKAVSYVKFINNNEMITASTDCSLRLWDLKNETECKRTFTGHTNEKNFVGLSVNCDGEFISCGSETNQIFVYHSQLTEPITNHRFENSIDPVTV